MITINSLHCAVFPDNQLRVYPFHWAQEFATRDLLCVDLMLIHDKRKPTRDELLHTSTIQGIYHDLYH